MASLEKIIFVVIGLIFLTSFTQVFGQQISLGEPASQTVEITISENGEVRVIHDVQKSNNISQIDLVEGKFSNLKVVDVEGNDVQHAMLSAEKVGITIFPTREDVIVEYDLSDVLTKKDGIWVWNYLYIATTIFYLPEDVNLIFVNDTPVKTDGEGVRCHGCSAFLEYVIDEPINLEEVLWEDKKFLVEIKTLTDVSSFSFDQPTKSISFNVNEDNQLITMIIPLEMLWNPYQVYLDDQKILKHEFFANATHAWLNIRPETSGTIQIIGTTVVPEFPLFAPLFLGVAAVIILQFGKKLNLH